MATVNGNGDGHSNGNGNDSGNTEVPYRGDIIVNSDALFALCTDIHNYKGIINSKKTGKYIDTLYFLEENGYRVIIPEMISFKAGRILASGDDINDFLGDPIDPKRNEILKPILKDASLLKVNKNKEHFNINIRANTGPAEIDDFCKRMQDVSDEYTKRIVSLRHGEHKTIHVGTSYIGFKEANREVLHLLKKKEEAKKKGFEYGNEAIISLVGKDHINASDKPIFVLTDDEELTKRIHAKSPYVNTITSTSLINGIVDAGLGEKVGIPLSPPSPRPMISAKHLEKRQREVSALFDEYKNAKVETYISPVNNRQLPKSLEELAAYLKQHKKEAKPDLGLDKANVAKFIAREAKKRVPLDPKISDNTALNR